MLTLFIRTPSPRTQPARATRPEERTVTSECTTLTRAISTSCTRSRGSTSTGNRDSSAHVARRAGIETQERKRERRAKRESRLFVESKKVFSGSIDRQAGRRFWQENAFLQGHFLGAFYLGVNFFWKTVGSRSRNFSAS